MCDYIASRFYLYIALMVYFKHLVNFYRQFDARSLRRKRSLPKVSKQSFRDFTDTVFAVVIDKQARRGDSRG